MAVTLAYERIGRGAPRLLLLHGFAGSRHSWEHFREPLERIGALVVDLPGHGDTPLPETTGASGFVQTLESLNELTRTFGPLDFLGYSQGARVALAYAVRYPDCVRRLILESGSPGLRHRKARHARRVRDEQLARFLEQRGVQAFVERWEQLPLFAGLRALPSSVQAGLRRRRSAHRPEGLAGALRTLGTGVQPAVWRHLPRLRRPTLLITGRMDAKYSRIAREMGGQLPCAWRCALDAHHAPHLETPHAYWQEVRSFLEAPMDEVFNHPHLESQ